MKLEPRKVKLSTRTGTEVERLLPHARLRKIGAWCFVDHFSPTQETDSMVVAAHPHTGLQTVTWLLEGEVEHRDSLGTIQLIKPGQLNLMTAGRGISHSELSHKQDGNLHAVQLWVALPDSDRHNAPAFEHRDDLPIIEVPAYRRRTPFALGRTTADENAKITVLVGTLFGQTAKTTHFTPLVGAEIRVPGKSSLTIPVDQKFEHGVLLVGGDAEVTGSATLESESLAIGELAYFNPGHAGLTIENLGADEATLIVIGGEPFTEQLVMWWNFIGRSHDEIVGWRETWNTERETAVANGVFGQFSDEVGSWIPAPDLPNVTLRAR